MIEFRNVTKTYPRSHHHALRDISFRISQGEFVYITGHSGAGKSTLLSLVLRRIIPTSGNVFLLRQDIAQVPKRDLPQLRRSIGMVFQDHKLLGHLTVQENLTFALRAIAAKGDLHTRALAMLRLVALAHKRKAYPVELSLGEQQRVAIARALVTNPPLLLCDEPTGNLDPDTSWDILELLNAINMNGTTVIVATHAKEMVNQLKRRTLVLRTGEIVRDDSAGGYSL